ncbi:ssDNA-binding domain-containing protein [Synergistaceae bacterium OttesenSCG-928-I11]|nr:ssDNA-binding domain-containing protein [Synergistaceae bacterium OttesenSCG-928-I11]
MAQTEARGAKARVEKMRDEFAERVAGSLSQGVVPWQDKKLPIPPVQSAVSGGKYGGVNMLYLLEKCARESYDDPRFITASAANEHGLWVRKGERGVPLERWQEKESGKVEAQVYTVFNVKQLSGDLSKLPTSESPLTAVGTEKAEQMLKNAGVDVQSGSSVKDFQDAIKKLVAKFAEEAGYRRDVHTPELMALRNNIASTVVMREAGLPVEQAEGLPTKSWASSIHHDPSQLYKATRDGSHIAKSVIGSMTQEREENLFRAGQQRIEAQKAQEIVAEAVTVPRGADFNLFGGPNADLSATQETVVAATAKAATQVNELRASATRHETSAAPSKFTEAREAAKKHLGSGAIVTNAQPDKTYGGKIVGVLDNGPDKTAIQVISDNHAVLHTVRDIAAKSSLNIGDDVNLSVNEDGDSVVQGRAAEKAKKAELAREGMKR